MDRFCSLASHLFGYLAFALAVLAPLAVPQNAFADSGSDCASACSAGCNGDTTCMMNCSSVCSDGGCNARCYGDPSCEATCSNCISQCNGNSTCQANCAGAISGWSPFWCSSCTTAVDPVSGKSCDTGLCLCVNPIWCRINSTASACYCPP